MRLAYNGITLAIVQVLEESKVAEYDPTGQDYLWTRYRIAVEAIYNPDDPNFAVAYTTAELGPNGRPKPDSKPVRNSTTSAVYTDVALRHKLMQPRGELLIDYASDPDPKKQGDAAKQLWLDSPPKDVTGNRRPCDLKNGPLPQEDTVVRTAGDGRTFIVRFVVETYLNDCEEGTELRGTRGRTNPPPPLLSNRWTATMSYDDGGYATRTFTGLAIFRADVLREAQAGGSPYWTPDAWRLDILPPVPANSIRYVDAITPSPDGFSYQYTVRDVEQEVTLLDVPTDPTSYRQLPAKGRRNVRSISCEVFRQYQSAGTKEALPQFINTFQQAAWGTRESLSQFSDLLAPGAVAAIGIGLGVAGTLNNLLPTYSEVVVCTVQGTRNATKAQLFRLAYSCAFGQLSNPLALSSQNEMVNGGMGGVVATVIPRSDEIRQTIADAYANMARLVPPATTLSVRFDAFKKRVQVTVGQEFGGLLDWTTGATAGGLRMVTRAPAEEVVGGDWPQHLYTLNFVNDGVLTSNPITGGAIGVMALGTNAFPKLGDNKTLIGTTDDGPGIDLPLAAPPADPAKLPPIGLLPPTPAPYSPPRQGTQLFNVIAASLLGECQTPDAYGTPDGADYPRDRGSSFRQGGKPPSP